MPPTRRPHWSVRARILAAILVVAGLGITIAGSATFAGERARVLTNVDDQLRETVSTLRLLASGQLVSTPANGAEASPSAAPPSEKGAKRSRSSSPAASYATVQDLLRSVMRHTIPAPNESSVALLDGDARFISGSSLPFHLEDDTAFLREVKAETEGGSTVLGTTTSSGRTLRYVAIPLSVKGDSSSGLFVAAFDLGAELSPVTESFLTFAWVGLVTLAAIGIVGWFVAGRLLRPLRQLREAAAGITVTDLGARIPAIGNDDVTELTRTVNSMLERLDAAVTGQRKLLDDIRHELKTPITIVRGHLELLDPTRPDDAATVRDLGIAELDRMSRLISDIDLLATAELGDAFRLTPVDLDELTERVGDMVRVIPDHSWSVAGRAPVVVRMDADRITQAWLQLADNAAKYAPAGSPIEIGSSTAPDEARLWVRDHGTGIPAEATERIFSRFGRIDVGRTVGGSGLGLAIVRAIARGHGGDVTVEETPGGGATFLIRLPADVPTQPIPILGATGEDEEADAGPARVVDADARPGRHEQPQRSDASIGSRTHPAHEETTP